MSKITPSWCDNRELLFRKRLIELKVGDALVSSDSQYKIVRVFTHSRLPQYIVFKGDVKIFPKRKASTSQWSDVLAYLLSQSESDSDYIPHVGMAYCENGAMQHMVYVTSG